MNRWNIPGWLEREVLERDSVCVYCGVAFSKSNVNRATKASWEHIINNASIVTRENIAICCVACNASKGTKALSSWLQSNYCKRKGITPETIADVAKAALENQQSI